MSGAKPARPAAPAPHRASRVPSPCVGVCRMQADTGLCEGCHRTLDEIAAWGGADDATRMAVWRRIRVRRAAAVDPGMP